jgi:hypothetical protein
MQQKSKIKALFINIIPGVGHYYLGNRPQGIAYFLISFGGYSCPFCWQAHLAGTRLPC